MRVTRFLGAAILFAVLLGTGLAQNEGFDELAVVLLYHKMTGEPIANLQQYVQNTEAMRRLSNFDRHDAEKAEVARILSQVAAANLAQEFSIKVNDSVSEYDFNRGEFTIMLFKPGSYVPVNAFGKQYQLVFTNSESARVIRKSKEEARELDAELNRNYRRVVDEIRFKVTGKGDPSGAVTGFGVIRAEMLSVRVLDPAGRELLAPNLSIAAGSASVAPKPAFDISQVDVSGLRVGVKAKDLEASLTRLFGPVRRGGAAAWYAGTLSMNEMGGMNIPGRPDAKIGAVCVVALFDRDEVVRSVRITRIFRFVDQEMFRTSLIQKYGAVANAKGSGMGYSLGWGPEVDTSLGHSQGVRDNALTARYEVNDSLMSRGGNNAAPQIRVVLHLVDAPWASGHTQ